MKNIFNVKSKLDSILKKIENDEFLKNGEYKKGPIFRGADIQIALNSSTVDKKLWIYREDKCVFTKYFLELSYLLISIRDAYEKYFNHQNKFYYYEKLADASNEYLEKNKNSENCKDLLLCVIKKAIEFLPEFESEQNTHH